MAVTSGTVASVAQIKSDTLDPLQFAVVYFTMSGTYAQADNSQLLTVPTLIQNSLRNGKTVTMKTVGLWQAARKSSDPTVLLALKTVAISSTTVTFEITLSATANALDISTEFTDATALPAQSVPFGILVGYVES